MATKILLLALAAAFTWWLTRPRKKQSRREKKHLTQCEKCGVYNETDSRCECEKDA